MVDATEQDFPLIHHKNQHWLTKLEESRGMVMWLEVFVLLGAFGGVAGGFVGPLVGYSLGAAFIMPICFLVGLAIGLSVVFTARFLDRQFFGALKVGVTNIENRLIEGTSVAPREDLEKLVAGSLKLKRMAAADVYSRRLLALTMQSSDNHARVTDWVVATDSWASTEKYHRGLKYSLVWLYETRGVLTLSPDCLDFQSKKFTIQCHPSLITAIKIKRHPLWMKPIPLKYISLTIEEFGCEHTFNFTPSFGQTDTVWDCNRMVDVWSKRLEMARALAAKPPVQLELTEAPALAKESAATVDAAESA